MCICIYFSFVYKCPYRTPQPGILRISVREDDLTLVISQKFQHDNPQI